MTQYDDDYDLEDEANDSPLMKQLRKQIKTLTKERDDAANAKKAVEQSLNEFKVRDVLSERGISDKRAPKFLAADGVDLSNAQAVDTWLTENGDLFGYKPAEPERNQQTAEALQAMGNAEAQGAITGREHAGVQEIHNAQSADDVLGLLMGKYGNQPMTE